MVTTTSCPFCNCSYLQLGKHLPHCKERNGRDYSHLLSAKTLQKKSQLKKKTECPKCHRSFKRLDTHFRVSATCKMINPIPSPNNPDMHSSPTQPFQGQSTDEDAIFFTLLGLNFADTASAAPVVSTLTTATTNTSSHQTKASLSLPTTAAGWEQADLYFQTFLIPATLAATSPQEMSRVLCEGVYSYFASTYGTKTTTARKTKKRPLHNRALKEVERKKKEAKRELRSARRSGSSGEVAQSLARHFFSLVRTHSQLKRAADTQLLSRDAQAIE